MEIKVKDIGEDGIDVDLPVTPAWLAAQCPDLEARPSDTGLAFKGRVVPSGDKDYLLRGRFKGALHTSCSRCLEDARLPITAELSIIYVEGDSRSDDDEDESADDAPDVVTFSDGAIDLTPDVRDELLLAVPVSVLCKESCKGLCAVCGGNRNQVACLCEEQQRMALGKLAGLAKLKTDS